MILAGIAIAVFLAQYRSNPAVDAFTNIGNVSEKNFVESESFKSIIPVPDNILPMTPREVFDSMTLSDKINGKAELYLSAGFEQLRTQRFRSVSISNTWIELFIFEMTDHDSAFSVYSMQKREDAVALEFAPSGYSAMNAMYLLHGNNYLELISSSASNEMNQIMKEIFISYIQANPIRTKNESFDELFPEDGMVSDSFRLIAANVFGYGKLTQVYAANYRYDDSEATAFFSIRENSDEAESLKEGFIEYLKQFGGSEVELTENIPHAYMIKIFDTYDIFFVHDRFFAGVHEAYDSRTAQKIAELLYHNLKTE